MIELFVVLLVLYLLYKLLIEGWLFKIIVFIFGWIGMYLCLGIFIHDSRATALTLGANTHVSWAAVIPTIICIAVLACTKVEK